MYYGVGEEMKIFSFFSYLLLTLGLLSYNTVDVRCGSAGAEKKKNTFSTLFSFIMGIKDKNAGLYTIHVCIDIRQFRYYTKDEFLFISLSLYW